MTRCNQIVGHTVDAHGEPDKDIECGKPAAWHWKGQPSATACDACHETYRSDPSLFVDLVALPTEEP